MGGIRHAKGVPEASHLGLFISFRTHFAYLIRPLHGANGSLTVNRRQNLAYAALSRVYSLDGIVIHSYGDPFTQDGIAMYPKLAYIWVH